MLIFLVQISGNKGVLDGKDGTSPEDPGLGAGCRDYTGLRAASPGWIDGGIGVDACVLCLGRRVECLFGDQND